MSVGHLTPSSPYLSAFTRLESSCGQRGPCSTSAARTVRHRHINAKPSVTSVADSPGRLTCIILYVCSRSLLQHAAGGGRPAAAGERSYTPADPRRRQAVGREHSGEPAAPQGPHRPARTHTYESPPATVTSLR